jgi:hypothetical protein
MPGPRFCRLVSLLPAYGGAVARALAATAGLAHDTQMLPVPAPSARVDGPAPLTPAVAAMSPHADLFSFATSGGGDD